MHDTLHVRTCLIKPGMNKDFLRRLQAIFAGSFLAAEIHRNDIARLHETQARLLRATRLDQDFLLTGNPCAHVAARLLGKVKFSENPTRLGDERAQFGEIGHKLRPLLKNRSTILKRVNHILALNRGQARKPAAVELECTCRICGKEIIAPSARAQFGLMYYSLTARGARSPPICAMDSIR